MDIQEKANNAPKETGFPISEPFHSIKVEAENADIFLLEGSDSPKTNSRFEIKEGVLTISEKGDEAIVLSLPKGASIKHVQAVADAGDIIVKTPSVHFGEMNLLCLCGDMWVTGICPKVRFHADVGKAYFDGVEAEFGSYSVAINGGRHGQ